MKIKRSILLVLLFFLFSFYSNNLNAEETVTPNASTDAKALLEFVYSISGKYTLTGQHNYPNTKDRNSQFYIKYVDKTPAVWSTEIWSLSENKKVLSIKNTAPNFRGGGERTTIQIFEKN